MRERVQAAVDQSGGETYDAILLAYGLCNYGVRGLHAEVPLVLPRAHDCITLLLGSRQRYAEYFAVNPGTFYQSPGWIERDSDPTANPATTNTAVKMIIL